MESETNKLLLKDFVYISTLSDLGSTSSKYNSDMLKLDVAAGQYELKELYDGYVMAKDDYTPDFKDVVKIFWSRSGDKGLSGTYYHGEINDSNRMRLFNDYLLNSLHEKYYLYISGEDYEYEDYEELDSETDSGTENDFTDNVEGRKKLKKLEVYNNLPALFYLNQSINDDDLCQISLKFSSKDICNVLSTWRVVHDNYGDIGIAVLQKKLFNMLGDQAGLAFFATTSGNAFGNFNVNKNWEHIVKSLNDDTLFSSDYEYICKFNPCHCDWRYPSYP